MLQGLSHSLVSVIKQMHTDSIPLVPCWLRFQVDISNCFLTPSIEDFQGLNQTWSEALFDKTSLLTDVDKCPYSLRVRCALCMEGCATYDKVMLLRQPYQDDCPTISLTLSTYFCRDWWEDSTYCPIWSIMFINFPLKQSFPVEILA